MKKKMAFLQIHFLHLSLTSQEKVKEIFGKISISLINLGFRWEQEKKFFVRTAQNLILESVILICLF